MIGQVFMGTDGSLALVTEYGEFMVRFISVPEHGKVAYSLYARRGFDKVYRDVTTQWPASKAASLFMWFALFCGAEEDALTDLKLLGGKLRVGE